MRPMKWQMICGQIYFRIDSKGGLFEAKGAMVKYCDRWNIMEFEREFQRRVLVHVESFESLVNNPERKGV